MVKWRFPIKRGGKMLLSTKKRLKINSGWLVFVMFILGFSLANWAQFPGQQKEVKKKLEARVNFRVHWNIDTEDENNTGSLVLNLKGMLNYNEQMSSLPHGMMTIMLPYRIQNMQASYIYKERVIDKDPPKNCPELIADYNDSGTFDVPALPSGPGDLMAHHLGSIGKITKMNKIAPPEVKDLLHDYYDFFLVAPSLDIHGRVRGPDDCRDWTEADKNLQLCSIQIRYLMEEGRMSGKANWTTHREGGSAPLDVKVSNLPKKMEEEAFSPKNMPGNVRYSLSWEIKEPSAIIIQRKVGKEWKDIDSDEALKRVSVGERIELRGVAFPAEKKISAPSWRIDGNNNKNYIKKYEANNDEAKVIPLQGKDLQKMEVVFYWHKGDKGQVKFSATVGGTQHEKEAEFKIKRPDYSVTWDAAETTKIDKMIDGNDVKDKWPPANWPPNPHQYGKGLQGANLTGLRYDGILFTCSLKSDKPGETQWVQLVSGTQRISDFKQTYAPNKQNKELDKVYPCARNNSFFDAPGIPINTAEKKGYQSWEEINDFDLYIMFRPKGKNKAETEKNEWVPIKLIKWSWGGKIQRNAIGGDWYIYPSSNEPRLGGDGTLEPVGKHAPKVQDTEEYPTWTKAKKE
jgi:hypothetical protein